MKPLTKSQAEVCKRGNPTTGEDFRDKRCSHVRTSDEQPTVAVLDDLYAGNVKKSVTSEDTVDVVLRKLPESNLTEIGETGKDQQDASIITLTPSFHTQHDNQEEQQPTHTRGRIVDWPCQVTVNTGRAVTIAILDNTAGPLDGKPSRLYVLQTGSGDINPGLKEALVQLPLGRSALSISVFIPKIRNEFVPGLQDLRAYDAVVDLKHHLLRMGEEVVIMESWNTTTIYPHNYQRQRNTYSGRDCRNWTARRPPGGS